MKILIIDSVLARRAAVRDLIGVPGDEIMEADGTEAGLATFAAFKPDFVTVEFAPGDIEALSAIRFIRVNHPISRVIALTAEDDSLCRRAAFEAGASGMVDFQNLTDLFLFVASKRLIVSQLDFAASAIG